MKLFRFVFPIFFLGLALSTRADDSLKTQTRDAIQRNIFFDTWQTDKNLYMSIPEFRLGQPFLFATQLSQGIGVKGLSGARMAEREGRAVTLERFGERLFLLQKPM